MNRRVFMKSIGAALIAPAGILAAIQPKENPYLPIDYKQIFSTTLPKPSGKRIMFLHPIQARAFKNVLAKEKYKHSRHVKRWEARYGKKYLSTAGEFFEMPPDIRIIETRPI